MKDTLAALRAEVDAADDALVRALAARWRAIQSIGAFKRASGLRGYDPDRERALRERWNAIADDTSLDRALCDAVFDVVIARCRDEVTRSALDDTNAKAPKHE